MKKEFEQLNIIDNFLMNEIANDAEVGETACREIVSSLLQRKIGEVRIIPQKNIPPGLPNQRGIILDVEIEENIDNQEDGLPCINVYDVEPHRLHFIEHSTRENAVDDATLKMYDYVRQVKEQEVSKMRFMTYKDYFAEYYADEIEEAKEKVYEAYLKDCVS